MPITFKNLGDFTLVEVVVDFVAGRVASLSTVSILAMLEWLGIQ